MIIEPRVRQFICTTAHPYGCYQHVADQVAYAKQNNVSHTKIKNALIIGSSTGYGLSSRIALAFGLGANTIGVHYDKEPSERRTGTAGFYNTKAFDKLAKENGLKAISLNGDAFSSAMKTSVLEAIRDELNGETIDVVIYSLASPRRTMPDGTTYTSAIKPIGEDYENKSLNLSDNRIEQAQIEKATDDEIFATVQVMGGSDWRDWIDVLNEAGVLSPQAINLAYSYIGPEMTQGIYYSGTIGRAKQDLYKTAKKMREDYPDYQSHVAINKAVVTQSSTAIPSIALYVSALFKVMKAKGNHEDTIEQMVRLVSEKINPETLDILLDDESLIRLDDWEMEDDVQAEVTKIWEQVDSENVEEVLDIEGFWNDFYKLFGFRIKGVDYNKDVDLLAEIGENNPS